MPTYIINFGDGSWPATYDWSQWTQHRVDMGALFVPPEDQWVSQPDSGLFVPPPESEPNRTWYDDFLFGYGNGRFSESNPRTQTMPDDDDLDYDGERLYYPDAIEVESHEVRQLPELEA